MLREWLVFKPGWWMAMGVLLPALVLGWIWLKRKKIAKGISNKPLSHQATERYRRLLILLEKRDLEKSPRKLEFK